MQEVAPLLTLVMPFSENQPGGQQTSPVTGLGEMASGWAGTVPSPQVAAITQVAVPNPNKLAMLDPGGHGEAGQDEDGAAVPGPPPPVAFATPGLGACTTEFGPGPVAPSGTNGGGGAREGAGAWGVGGSRTPSWRQLPPGPSFNPLGQAQVPTGCGV